MHTPAEKEIYLGPAKGFYDERNFRQVMRGFSEVDLRHMHYSPMLLSSRGKQGLSFQIECPFSYAPSHHVVLDYVIEDEQEVSVVLLGSSDLSGIEDVLRVERAVLNEASNFRSSTRRERFSKFLHNLIYDHDTTPKKLLETPQTPSHSLDLHPLMRRDYLRANPI